MEVTMELVQLPMRLVISLELFMMEIMDMKPAVPEITSCHHGQMEPNSGQIALSSKSEISLLVEKLTASITNPAEPVINL